MSKESRQAVRAVFLAAIMVISVFAAGIAFSGSAAAQDVGTGDSTYPSPDPTNFDYAVDADGDLSDDDGVSEGDFNGTYDTLAAAVGAADTNNKNILVLPGEYRALNKSGQSVAGDNIVLASAEGPQNTIIESPDSQGVRVGGKNVVIKGFKIESQGSEGIYLTSDAANATVEYNILNDTTGDPVNATNGIRIEKRSATVRHNAIKNHEQGILLASNFETADRVLITENRFVNSGLSGIYIVGIGSTTSDHVITGNSFDGTIEKYNTGSDVIDLGGDILLNEDGADIKNISVHYNEFDETGTGISTLDTDGDGFTEAVNATNNYWGSPNGPSAGGENAYNDGNQGAEVSDNVEFTPWLDASTENGGQQFAPVTNDSGGQFATIQAAVDAASAGDTITVSSGTYEESVTIESGNVSLVGNDNPTIVGEGIDENESRPHPTIHIPSSNDNPTKNVEITGFTIQNPEGTYGIYIGSGGAGANVTGLEVTDNRIENIGTQLAPSDTDGGAPPLSGAIAGLYIRADYDGVLVENNVVTNVRAPSNTPGRATGLSFSSFVGDGGGNDGKPAFSTGVFAKDTVVRNNTVREIVSPDRTKGIAASGEFDGMTVEDNDIDNIDGKDGNAFGITFTENPDGGDIDGDGNAERVGPRNFTIVGNDVNGINASDPAALFIGGYEDLGDAHSVSNNNFREGTVNRFAGKQDGYQIGDGDTLNAENNYWGAASGPNGVISPSSNTDNPATLPDGDGVVVFTNGEDSDDNPRTGLVDVTPWLDAPAPDGAATAPVTNNDTDEFYPTIQAAVDDASPGSTVVVSAGTYNESIDVETENVTLQAAEGATPTIDYNPGPKDGIAETTLQIMAPNVTVDGLEIVGGDYVGAGISVQVNKAPTGVELKNNTIRGIGGGGGGEAETSYGILARGTENTLDDIHIENNTIENIGTEQDHNVGIGISLEELTNDEQGAVITDNTIHNVGNSSDVDNPQLGTGILIQDEISSESLSADAGYDANAEVDLNTISNSPIGVYPAGNVSELSISANTFEENLIDIKTTTRDGESSAVNGSVSAPLNYYGDDTPAVNVDSDEKSSIEDDVLYDPLLTVPVEQANVENPEQIRNYGSYIEVETEGEPTVIGFPAPPAEPLSELLSNDTLERDEGEGVTFFIYDNANDSFEIITDLDSTTPQAGEVLVITTENQSTISEEIIVPVETDTEDPIGAPTEGEVQLDTGWNLVATGAANSADDPIVAGTEVLAGTQLGVTQPSQPGAPDADVGAYHGTWILMDDEGILFTGYAPDTPPLLYADLTLNPDTDNSEAQE